MVWGTCNIICITQFLLDRPHRTLPGEKIQEWVGESKLCNQPQKNYTENNKAVHPLLFSAYVQVKTYLHTIYKDQ